MATEYVAVAFTILFTIATSLLLGRYMFHVFTDRRTLLDPIFVPLERLVLRLTVSIPASSRTGRPTPVPDRSRTSPCGW